MKIKILLIIIINLTLLLLLLMITSVVIRYFIIDDNSQNLKSKNLYNANTIRATYPVYGDIPIDDAINLFTDYAGPGTTYYPFLGWRRNEYKGKSVNVIDQDLRVRDSINHNIENATWFFGGSTMWGTGSDDKNTIPSHFAKLTGENVLNLGESGYLSFQEYTQLTMLLAKGHKPKKVIFYDGVNESYYCNTNNNQFPTHSRAEKWEEYIKNYPKLQKKYTKLKKKVKLNAMDDSITRNINLLTQYFELPYVMMYKKIFDKTVIGADTTSEVNPLNVDIPMKEYTKKRKYKNCDLSLEKVTKATETTVNTWLMAHDLIESMGIEFYVFLQPQSRVSRSVLKLDYLIDRDKQRIADEEDSSKAQYTSIKKIWLEKCELHKACDSFFDISNIFDGMDKPIYIDAVHIGPTGNEIVANKISKLIK